jgi:hypothetical protein
MKQKELRRVSSDPKLKVDGQSWEEVRRLWRTSLVVKNRMKQDLTSGSKDWLEAFELPLEEANHRSWFSEYLQAALAVLYAPKHFVDCMEKQRCFELQQFLFSLVDHVPFWVERMRMRMRVMMMMMRMRMMMMRMRMRMRSLTSHGFFCRFLTFSPAVVRRGRQDQIWFGNVCHNR